MKIRSGFVTNSSSTNFLIISKEELTQDYLFRKLGFKVGGALEEQGNELCANIIRAVNSGLRYYNYDKPEYLEKNLLISIVVTRIIMFIGDIQVVTMIQLLSFLQQIALR